MYSVPNPLAHYPLRSWLAALAMIIASGCGPIPEDPEKTTERVLTEGAFTVGVTAGSNSKVSDPLIEYIERQLDAEATIVRDDTNQLLYALQKGHVDLVIGLFTEDSVWSERFTLTSPTNDDSHAGEIHIQIATRKGENRWLSEIEKAVRNR